MGFPCSMNFATGFPPFFPSAHIGLAHVGRCWDLARKIPLEFPDWWLRILTTDFLLVDIIALIVVVIYCIYICG